VQPPDVSLGTLIADGTPSALTYPWMFFFAAGLLVVFVLAVNLVGDGLRDALDPTSDRARRSGERRARRRDRRDRRGRRDRLGRQGRQALRARAGDQDPAREPRPAAEGKGP
jgi:hypothetical protein